MKKKNKTIEDKLKDLGFLNLSEAESSRVWKDISEQIEPQPFFSLFPLQGNRKNMIPLMIGLIMFAGVGTTVAANGAAPGDLLFPIDRAAENVRLALSANANAKAELKARFAEERLSEVKELIAKARLEANATSTATTTPKRADGRVAVGVNFAISYLEKVAAEVAASGNAEASAEIRNVVASLENISNEADVKAVLKSNDDFKFWLRDTSLNATSSATTSSEVKINTSGNKTRIEVREDGDRIRIEIKDTPSEETDGDVRVKTKVDGSGCVELQTFPPRVVCPDDDDDEDEDRDDDDVSATGSLRIDLR